jgi:hypothetical protein
LLSLIWVEARYPVTCWKMTLGSSLGNSRCPAANSFQWSNWLIVPNGYKEECFPYAMGLHTITARGRCKCFYCFSNENSMWDLSPHRLLSFLWPSCILKENSDLSTNHTMFHTMFDCCGSLHHYICLRWCSFVKDNTRCSLLRTTVLNGDLLCGSQVQSL